MHPTQHANSAVQDTRAGQCQDAHCRFGQRSRVSSHSQGIGKCNCQACSMSAACMHAPPAWDQGHLTVLASEVSYLTHARHQGALQPLESCCAQAPSLPGSQLPLPRVTETHERNRGASRGGSGPAGARNHSPGAGRVGVSWSPTAYEPQCSAECNEASTLGPIDSNEARW